MRTRPQKLSLILRGARPFFIFAAALSLAFLVSCSEIQKPVPKPFFAESSPPAKQVFRWSNGKAPKSFDPARAAAAPETDIVRALFEGLTDIDAKTLKETPAVAEKWTSTEESRVWTFHLRKNAHWSNGKPVTAADFVSSWKRLASLGDKTAHPELFQNIVGLRSPKAVSMPAPDATSLFMSSPAGVMGRQLRTEQSNTASAPKGQPAASPEPTAKQVLPKPEIFGVEAVDDWTLKVTLERPDKDLPKLVANPIFRPVYGDGLKFETDPLNDAIVTNGPFAIANIGKDGVVLDRSKTYWNTAAVGLDTVRFVPKENAEAALDAYKKGEIDAVTNAEFEPLVLKLLAPYDDFRQTTHSALNFYEFNTRSLPYSDRRVREALAISIDRERLTAGELESSAQPATAFLPLGERKTAKLLLDVDKAKKLLENAGFPNGEGFPKIRLVINRNDTQQRVARVVAKMWKQNLNLDTEINVKEPSELESLKASGQYDLLRRGIVLPTVDESVSMAAILGTLKPKEVVPPAAAKDHDKPDTSVLTAPENGANENGPSDKPPLSEDNPEVKPVLRVSMEDAAVFELNAIPLYFPMSYSLVKPYVDGFEMNGLDAPMLQDISIDNNWQPNAVRGES